jgi:hypothetical protein
MWLLCAACVSSHLEQDNRYDAQKYTYYRDQKKPMHTCSKDPISLKLEVEQPLKTAENRREFDFDFKSTVMRKSAKEFNISG